MSSNLSTVPTDRQCGAKTRAGPPCKNWGILPLGRLRMHGGKSPGGYRSPHLRHGWYSRHGWYPILRRIEEARQRRERYLAERLAALGIDNPMHR